MNMQSGSALGISLMMQVRAFWSWWSGELENLIPAHWRQRFQGRERRLRFTGDAVEIDLAGQSKTILLGQIGQDPTLSTWQTQDAQHSRLLVTLPDTQLLRKVIQLPAATEPRLATVLGYELDRHTPFTPQQASFGFRVLRRDRVARSIEVELFVMPNEQRQRLTEALGTHGFVPVWILPERLANDLSLRQQLNLMPEALVKTSRKRRFAGVGALMILLLAALAGAFYLQQLHWQSLQQEVAPLLMDAELAEQVRNEADAMERSANYMVQRRLQQPSVLVLLDELTRQVPDTTWVSRFELSKGELQIQGESSNASTLISSLESSHLLQEVSFTSPVTINPRSRKERFSLRAEIEWEGLP